MDAYVGSRMIGGVPSYGSRDSMGPSMSTPSFGTRNLVSGIQSRLDANPGEYDKEESNKPIVVNMRLIPWPDMMHQQLFEGMVVAANSIKGGTPAHLTVLAPIGYINAQSIRNFKKHAPTLDALLPQIDQSWYESPIRAAFESERDKMSAEAGYAVSIKDHYGTSSLENAEKALKRHREAMRRRNNSGMQEIELRLLKEVEVARENVDGREKFYREFHKNVKTHRKNEFATCTVGRLISEWRMVGAVLSTISNKRDQLVKNTMNVETTIGVVAGGWTNTFNVWSNYVKQGTYLWFIVKPQNGVDGSMGAPVFIPWESVDIYDRSEPPLHERAYIDAQGLMKYGPAICYGMVAEKPRQLTKSDVHKSIAMGYGGESWKDIRSALAILDHIKVQQIKNRNIYF